MARPFNLEVQESIEYLSKSLKNARKASEKERLQMLWWIKTEQVKQHQELSRRLGSRWVNNNTMVAKVSAGGTIQAFRGKNCARGNSINSRRNA